MDTQNEDTKMKLATVGSALPVISKVMDGEGACPSVNVTAFATKRNQLSNSDCYHNF